MLDIDPQKLEKLIVEEAVNQIFSRRDGDDDKFGAILSDVRMGVDKRIDAIFADHADALIQERVDAAIKDGFEREYSKIDQWGKREGKPTTISNELSRIVTTYWSEQVDRSGKPTSHSYNSMTRAEHVMTKICAEDFSKEISQMAANLTGHLKDGLRDQIGQEMDTMLAGLFRVKSLQDQGKVEKSF